MIFIDYSFLHSGGVPNEHREFAEHLANHINFTVLCSKTKNIKNYEVIYKIIKLNIFQIIHYLISQDQFEICVFPGYFSLHNIILILSCILTRRPYIILPYSQITEYSFNNDLFSTNPDIRSLEKESYSKRQRLSSQITLLKKSIFHILFGRILLKRAIGIGVFSKYEMKEILRKIELTEKKFFQFYWGVNTENRKIVKSNYFEKYKYNPSALVFSYWGRIDSELKGIDRIINAVNWLILNKYEITFEVFLIGPDYNNGMRKTLDLIARYDLDHYIHILGPDKYIPGSKQPLIDSDVSVYLSRWDGFPRTLRESVIFGIPVVVSEETHFGDLVSKYGWGLDVPSDSSDENYAMAFYHMSDKNFLKDCKGNLIQSQYILYWENIVKDFSFNINKFYRRG